ncbi:hypothetical protein [Xanthobacter agilis]|uniref:Head-tail adaptor protein n=1 Tax=Xanthobacter agilis TaxID=47492 RepID=A0ABU0LJX8_XANAG|nr:hypothetical protein [Xanthobacter agilis]MDQ0507407.1 hypothetical protein [Xanthobacter agilis]
MPLLDVSELLTDPDFADTITVYRQAVTIGDTGRSGRAETATSTVAVVTPDQWSTLQRQAEGSNVSETITVITQFRLIASMDGYDADEIAWNGKRYVVRAVGDCSRYGAGFVEASCDLKGMSPP